MNLNSDKNYEIKKEIKNMRWLLFAVMLTLFASEVVFQAVASFMSNPPNNYVRMAVVEITAFLIPFALYAKMGSRSFHTKKELRLNPLSVRKTIFVTLLGITGQFVVILLNFPLEYLHQMFISEKEAVVAEQFSYLTLIQATLAVGIIPAFFEEFLIRGMVFRAMNRLSTRGAVWFTTFIFVVFHGKPECIFGYAFMGCMAVFVMRRTGSLYSAILYHFASNMAAVIFGMLAIRIVSLLWTLVAVMVILFIAVFILFYIKYTPEKNVEAKRWTNVFLSSVLSLPILLSIMIVVIKYWLLNLR